MTAAASPTSTEPLLTVRGLQVVYGARRGFGRPKMPDVRAVDGVDFEIRRGESLGLVGESGSGKSTIALALERLTPITAGSIDLDGHDLAGAKGSALRQLRRRVQMVFQDPYSSLDPSMTIEAILSEPVRVHSLAAGEAVRPLLVTALEDVGLQESDLAKYPAEFSGGQRQRIAIARALICDPDLVILDEATSALDVSTRAQVMTLLENLRVTRNLAFLFIGHDLAVVRRMSDRIAVMYRGKLVESGPADRVVRAPGHPYTASLLASVPDPRRTAMAHRETFVGHEEEPGADPSAERAGCVFASRCPFVMPVCQSESPPSAQIDGGGHAACHLHMQGPELNGRSVLELASAADTGLARAGTAQGDFATNEMKDGQDAF